MSAYIIDRLTSKDDSAACAFAEQIIAESRQSDAWYGCFDVLASLLHHPKSFVRNRVMQILAANARWDAENRFDEILPEFLLHITDDKPITARQCIQALTQVGLAKPQYIPSILSAMETAELSKYKDTMRPLIERDMAQAREKFTMKQA